MRYINKLYLLTHGGMGQLLPNLLFARPPPQKKTNKVANTIYNSFIGLPETLLPF